jgi:molecular chaperone DnaK
MGTGKEQNITIKASTQLPREEVDRLVEEAQKHAEEDKKQREAVEAKNSLEHLVYTVEKSLKDAGDKVSADEKAKVQKALESAKETLKTGSTEELKKAADDLRDAAAKLAEELYRQTMANEGTQAPKGEDAGATGQEGQPKGEVYDADFKEKDTEDPKH